MAANSKSSRENLFRFRNVFPGPLSIFTFFKSLYTSHSTSAFFEFAHVSSIATKKSTGGGEIYVFIISLATCK